MSWILLDAYESFSGYADEWQTLNTACNRSNPMLDIKFIYPLVKHFSRSKNIVLAIEKEGDIQSMLLLEKLSFGRWQLFMPSQAVVGPVIMKNRDLSSLLCSLKSLCAVLPGYVWQLGFQKQDPEYSSLALMEGIPNVAFNGAKPTTFIRTDGSFDDYFQGRPKRIRHKIRRTLRLLEEEKQDVKQIVIRDPGQIEEALWRYVEIESAGWKGAGGTAISRSNVQGKFYLEVLQNFAREDNACIYELHFGKVLAASLLTIKQNGMQVSLKTTYDERYPKYSPGRINKFMMTEKAFQDASVSVIENYTSANAEGEKWNSGSRDIFNVNYCRNAFYGKITATISSVRSSKGVVHETSQLDEC